MIDKVRVKGSYVYFQTFYTQTGDGTHLEFLAAHIVYILLPELLDIALLLWGVLTKHT